VAVSVAGAFELIAWHRRQLWLECPGWVRAISGAMGPLGCPLRAPDRTALDAGEGDARRRRPV